MPRKPVTSKKKGSRNITFGQELELLIGHSGKSNFLSEEERKKAWDYHKHRLSQYFNAGHRPRIWWKYDAPEPRKVEKVIKLDKPFKKWVKNEFNPLDKGHYITEYETIRYEDEITYLKRLNLLEDWEIAVLKRRGVV